MFAKKNFKFRDSEMQVFTVSAIENFSLKYSSSSFGIYINLLH